MSDVAGILILPVIAALIWTEYRLRKARELIVEKRKQTAKDLVVTTENKADKLSDDTYRTTRDNKEEVMDTLINSMKEIKIFINGKLDLVYKTFEYQNLVIKDIVKDTLKDTEARDLAFGKLEKSQDMLQQWYYGVKVKSDWPLLSGESEPPEHMEVQHPIDPKDSIFAPTAEELKKGEKFKDENESFEVNPDGTKGKKIEKKKD